MSQEKEIAERLHPIEVNALLPFKKNQKIMHEDFSKAAGLNASQIRTAVEWLLHKNIISSADEGKEEYAHITKRGEEYAKNGMPETRIIRLLKEKCEERFTMKELEETAGMQSSEISPVIGILKKNGSLSIKEGGALLLDPSFDISPFLSRENLLKKIRDKARINMNELSKEEQEEIRHGFVKRSPEKGIYRIEEVPVISYSLTNEGLDILPFIESKPVVNQLTPQLLTGGKWRDYEFRKYDITLNPPRIQIGRKHPYRQFLDLVRTKLVSLGFEEMTGPLVETEFWDMDALFMPQFHSARNIHDVYYIKDPDSAKSIQEPFLSNVAECHKSGGNTGSRGWKYNFDTEKTKRLVMRSQGTALSARKLAKGPETPGKYFAIARCFRYEQIDVTHGTDFFQIEGIVVDRDITFKKLLGLLALFAKEVAKAKEIKFAPAYFPFTEPSVELHAKHPNLGWMELGGAGIFRPEVTIPLNVNVPVIAWGLGIDRMAMVSLGIKDIRQLFSHDLEFIRNSKVVY